MRTKLWSWWNDLAVYYQIPIAVVAGPFVFAAIIFSAPVVLIAGILYGAVDWAIEKYDELSRF